MLGLQKHTTIPTLLAGFETKMHIREFKKYSWKLFLKPVQVYNDMDKRTVKGKKKKKSKAFSVSINVYKHTIKLFKNQNIDEA